MLRSNEHDTLCQSTPVTAICGNLTLVTRHHAWEFKLRFIVDGCIYTYIYIVTQSRTFSIRLDEYIECVRKNHLQHKLLHQLYVLLFNFYLYYIHTQQ